MRTLTVSLSQQQVTRLQRVVESGAYASNSEVVRDALRLWEPREEIRQLEVARMRQAYDAGVASGEGREVDAKTLLAALKAEAHSRG